jgi:hypothetical protein
MRGPEAAGEEWELIMLEEREVDARKMPIGVGKRAKAEGALED